MAVRDLEWAAFTRPWIAGQNGDRFAIVETSGALVVVVADGVGNSHEGARAAELVVRAVRDAPPSADEWDLQELLFRLDEALVHTGGETTALILAFAGERLVGAAAGDTVAFLRRRDGGILRFPEPRTRFRLGSGCADVHVVRVDDVSAGLAMTDGVSACARYDEIASALATATSADELAGWARRVVEERIGRAGDDATGVALKR